MKIGILGVKPKDLPKFKSAAKLLNISVEHYNPSDLIIEVDKHSVKVLDYNMQPIQVDGVVNWMSYAKNYYELYEAFSYSNIPCVNSVSSVRNCRNKLLTNIILNKYKIPQPKTIFMSTLVRKPKISLKTPIVFKKKTGSGGIGACKLKDLNETYDFLKKKIGKRNIYLQEYVKNNGWDMRVIIVGNKVIGGIKKIAKQGEWRTHVKHGGLAEPCLLSDTVISMCLKTAKALNIDFAGIDIMQDIQGNYFILEVNSCPGLSLFYETTGISIAYEILKYLKHKVLKNIDSAEPLSVNHSHSVASKMKKTQIILENPLIKPYIPETIYLNLKNLKWMLSKFQFIVFKPDKGSGGKFVGAIRRNDKNNTYTLHYQTNFYEYNTINEMVQFIIKLAPQKKFIIQKGIDLIKYNNNPVDIRIYVQKPFKRWEITGIIARVAGDNKMVTNARSGGTSKPLIEVFNNNSFSEAETSKLKKTMYTLAYQIGNSLNEVYPEVRELGLDFGVDQNLYPWILEVNTKPKYNKLQLLEDKTMYNIVHKYNRIIHNLVD